MSTIRSFKNRLELITNIGKYTKALQIIAATRLRKAAPRALHSQTYQAFLKNILLNLCLSCPEERHPLFIENETKKKTALIVVSTDKGHCGSYNSIIFAKANQFIKESPLECSLILIGNKAISHFSRKKEPILLSIPSWTKRGTSKISKEISKKCIDWHLTGFVDEIQVLYVKQFGMMNKEVAMEKYLSIALEKPDHFHVSADPIYEPNPKEIFRKILPFYCFYHLKTILDAAEAAKFSARSIAMQMASKNAEELSKTVTLQLNRQRQANITTESIEISTHASTF